MGRSVVLVELLKAQNCFWRDTYKCKIDISQSLISCLRYIACLVSPSHVMKLSLIEKVPRCDRFNIQLTFPAGVPYKTGIIGQIGGTLKSDDSSRNTT